MTYEVGKRVLDVAGAAAGLVLAAPLLLATAIVVAVVLGPPALFRQVRAGRHGVPFTLLKFRTMRDVDVAQNLVADADRLTRLGRILRASSLDELPSLWNVLRGDMSLVGPRPLPVRYLEMYSPEQARRHDVRPGVTGLAQVSGRNALSWDDKLSFDIDYVDNRSTSLDLRVLVATVVTVLRRHGISAEGEATAAEFQGCTERPQRTSP